MENFLQYGLIGVAVALAMLYLNKGAASKIEPLEEGAYELRLHRLYQLIGFLGPGLGVVLFLLPLIEGGLEALPVALAMGAMFGALGVACMLWYKNHILRFDAEKISARSWLGKTTEVQWTEIQSISFNSLSGLVNIRDSRGVAVKAHMHLVGLSAFVQEMEQKTSWTARGLRLPLG